jgi:hypothetical protein
MSYNQDTTNSYRIQGRINKFWAYILSGKTIHSRSCGMEFNQKRKPVFWFAIKIPNLYQFFANVDFRNLT